MDRQHTSARKRDGGVESDHRRALRGARHRQNVAVGGGVVVVANAGQNTAGGGGAVFGDCGDVVDGDRGEVDDFIDDIGRGCRAVRVRGGDMHRVRAMLGCIGGESAGDDAGGGIDGKAGGQAGGGEGQCFAVGIAQDGAHIDRGWRGAVGGGHIRDHMQRINGRDRVLWRAGVGRIDHHRGVVLALDGDDQRRHGGAAIAVGDGVADRLGRRRALGQAIIGRAGSERVRAIGVDRQHTAASCREGRIQYKRMARL